MKSLLKVQMHSGRPLTWVTSVAAAAMVVACGGNVSDGNTASGGSTDPDTAADQKAAALVARMTQDEKIQLVHGVGIENLPLGGASYIPGIARLGIPGVSSVDSASGPTIAGATALPSTLALAASWDLQLAYDFGAGIAKEIRALGFGEGLGGGVDLAREPRDGRTFEYMGEDPVLAGTMIAQRSQGTQSQNVIATIKHYAMNDQETNRFSSNSEVDERTMRELHLLSFEIGVKEGAPGNIMCSYNHVNGLRACENPYLLTDVLKKDWGFKGVVQSDWFFAVSDTARAANAGLDEEEAGSTDDAVGTIGVPTYFNQKLKAAVANGSVPQSRLDDMVQRKIRTYYRVGLMDNPPAKGAIDAVAGDALALRTSEQSMVLLKNGTPDGGTSQVLPLSAASVHSIAVIGGHADAGVISGGGSASGPGRAANAVACASPSYKIGNLQAISGCGYWYPSAPLAAIRAKVPNATVTYLDGNDTTAALSAAASADVTIVFATQWESEDMDLKSLSLPDAAADPANQTYDQNALIAAVGARAKRAIVVLESGTAVTMPWIDKVHGVLAAWYPGSQGGSAIANVLFGDVNPSGKLPLTFPVADTDLPQKSISATDLNVVYSEGLQIGYRWFDAQQIQPLFPFGFGLSYTTYSYSGMQTSLDSSGNLTVAFRLTNSGQRAGSEVAQVYAQLPSNTGEPPKRLVGWQKVSLEAGTSQTVTIAIPASRLKIWDVASHSWLLPAGGFTIYVGGSSRDSQALVSQVNVNGSTAH
ncbi:hypothetical protein BM43_4113 [Burkholderia gladioli]|uniref:Fibronectin type III-like domain-containing protein n=2 Tax=Burkholderia gladioli TaxID=28095 RepID=A0AAW3ETP5_BURGA|nr:hypothetical protein BM43_4113 [Burkholderia gladioli]KGC11330.1 hypothetical protein DM48_7382 [Burkholderia gladioli]